ncbi:WD40 repeat domain-containing protein [Actinacidiphila oryziradicis]|uniref:WD40 repeat domain-containing protein n=1 Tax=Actinacidiphila oryziradicis TaxID=2571141 RepID=A0A4U0RP06_9ACTN|nr:WD40 repeat domain-containing protein [Actinacidiphila oryziradicis]TJZ97107.1 hypothetical protein FCI23_50015 [Actinacidiphila oryziradicis]
MLGLLLLLSRSEEAKNVELRGHTESVQAIAFSADGTQLVTGGIDRSVRVWLSSTEMGA